MQSLHHQQSAVMEDDEYFQPLFNEQFEMLERIRRNSNDAKSVVAKNEFGTLPNSSESYVIPNYGTALGEALENNDVVEALDLNGLRHSGENIDKLLAFIQRSPVLRSLKFNNTIIGPVLMALSRRTSGVEYLAMSSIDAADAAVMASFTAFLRTAPTIGGVSFHPWRGNGEADDDGPIDQDETDYSILIDEELAIAATTARLGVIDLTWCHNFPPNLLERIKMSPSVRRVYIWGYWENPVQLGRLLRASRDANFRLSIRLREVSTWDRQRWLALVEELSATGDDVVTEFGFESFCELEGDVCAEILSTLLENNPRMRLFLGDVFHVEDRILEMIVSTALAIETDISFDSNELLCRCLTLPAARVESLHLDSLVCTEEFEAFIEAVPHFRTLHNLIFSVDGDAGDPIDNREDWKRKILQALWRNQSLTGSIVFENNLVDDGDRAFLERVVQRNRHLPGLLEPKGLENLCKGLWPHLLQVADETCPDLLFCALKGSPGRIFRLTNSVASRRRKRQKIGL